MTEEHDDKKLDPMTEMRIKIEQLEAANAAISEKFEKQSQMLSQALDSNMKLFAMVNSPASQSADAPKQTAQSDKETASSGYEEIVNYYR